MKNVFFHCKDITNDKAAYIFLEGDNECLVMRIGDTSYLILKDSFEKALSTLKHNNNSNKKEEE